MIKLRENGSFAPARREGPDRPLRNVERNEEVLEFYNNALTTSTRQAAQQLGINNFSENKKKS